MYEVKEIWENVKFFTGVLRDLPVSKSLTLDDGGYCVYTGDSHENWVYYPHAVNDVSTAEKVIKFFGECGDEVSFLWFMYGGNGKALTDSGLLYAGDMRAMTLDTVNLTLKPSNPDVVITPSTSHETWAVTSWTGFGGERDETPESYISFAEALSNDERVSLYTAEIGGNAVGTFLLTNGADVTGVYYFAVDPAARRKGIARSMMNEICRLSEGKRIVLQATPSGVPFYENFGFTDLFPIAVYSNTEDVF